MKSEEFLAVQTGKADMAMGAISVTEERQKQVLFSDGYVESHIVLITRKGEAGILSLTPDPSPKGEGSGYLWGELAILIIIIGGGTWFFLRRRRFTTLHSTPLSLGERLRVGELCSGMGSGVRLVHLRKSYGSLEVLIGKMLDGAMAPYRPITVRITHSEQSGVTALDFMVEKMTATPLNDAHRSELSGQCRQVIEEETKRGFRVKLII